LRICVVSQYFWPESFRINDLVQGLVERGHQVQVLTGQPNYPSGAIAPGYRSLRPRRSNAMGCEVLRVPLLSRGSAAPLRLGLNYLSFASSATLFGLGGIRKPVDVVLAYQPSPVTVAIPALALGRRLGVPVFMWIQDLWPDTLRATGALQDGPGMKIAGWITRKLHRALDGLLVQSQAFTPVLESEGVQASKIFYLPNWAEDYFRPTVVLPSAPERRELPKGFVILFAGNIGVAQGLEVLLGAAERVRDIKEIQWVVLGEGRQAPWLRAEVEKRRLQNVHVLGQRSPESMPIWFALADAMLVTLRPDPVYELTIPSKVQAYLACGRPILASLNGEGAREVTRADAGIASPAGDPAALADAAVRLYNLPEATRQAMGARARTHYDRNFDRATLIGRLEDALQRGINAREPAQSSA
jgi:glycosyltransferase involved in cell wall biosynthesis